MRKKRKLSKAELLIRQIENWERKQEGAVIMLRKSAEELLVLRRKQRRMLNQIGQRVPELVEEPVDKPADNSAAVAEVAEAEEDIPTFLDRTGKEKDEAARAEIEAEQEAERKRKAELRIKKLKISQETKQAELTGQRRKMPLTGKAALDALK